MKKLLLGLLVLLFAYLGYHYRSLAYGIKQAAGQIHILLEAEPIDRYLNRHKLDQSRKDKIAFINEIKQYAIDSLGIEPSGSYEKIYDQKGKPILWVLTASPEFELKAYEWVFPIAGSFSYKGYFDHEAVVQEKQKLEKQGLDVDLDEVSAWSTLGWLNDPILSSMLDKDSARLAELIIHELFHGTVFLKDSIELNENLASFVGRKGAERLLKSSGDTALINKNRLKREKRSQLSLMIMRSAQRLDSLYKTFDKNQSREKKLRKKQAMIEEIRWKIADKLADGNLISTEQHYLNFRPNNAYFTGYLTYRSKGDQFERELTEQFDGDIVRFIAHYKAIN